MSGPIHPGELLLEELLERGYIPNDFAEEFGIDPHEMLEICKSASPINEEIAKKLGESTGTTMQLWLNLQRSYEEGKMPGDIPC